ncbi:methyltransferase domain-containing protein [Apiospora hydei]|uniref:Methyltransferase domain-containing protein n=1 Tax=Apiospora hydei TaxID=1337664 RepID=A0ABR1X9Y9_9PEZI
METPEGAATNRRAEATQDARSHAVELPSDTEPTLRLLEQYSGIDPKDVPGLVRQVVMVEQQAQALTVFPYGCIKSFWFLNLVPTLDDPRYQAVAERLRTPRSTETFLDVGCCLGPVVRLLASQGVPDDRLHGTDLHAGFLDLGHELFGDRGRSRATYVAGDILDESDARLDVLRGKIDIIYALAFFHLFEREGQLEAAKRMVGFLRPENPRVMIFGQNQGPKIEGWEKYVLDPGRWTSLWEEVGRATGTRWRTEMEVESTDKWNNVRFGVYRIV